MKFCPSCLRCFEQALDLCADDQAALAVSPPHTLDVGGKYRIERLISRGRSVVCEGTQLKTERPVAIKLIPAEVSERTHQKALSVACLCTRIDHQHIVKTFGYGQLSGGLTYVVTELVGGITLREYLQSEGRLEAAEAALIARQVADGLVAAHGCGVVHGGLKPSNIFLARDYHGGADAKVFNFGLSDCPVQSSKSVGLGVDDERRYLSPEQLSGRGAEERSDVYSLGVILHEMLTGQASCARTAYRDEESAQGEVMPHRVTCCQGAPEALSALLSDALNEKPSARLLSAAEFASRLRMIECPAGSPAPRGLELAPPVSAPEPLSQITSAPDRLPQVIPAPELPLPQLPSAAEPLPQLNSSPPAPDREESVPPPHVVKLPARKIGLVDDFADDVVLDSLYQRENRPARVVDERLPARSGNRRSHTPPAALSHRKPPAHAGRTLAVALPAFLILILGVYGWLAFRHVPPPSTDGTSSVAPRRAAHMTGSLSPESGNTVGEPVQGPPSLRSDDDDQASGPANVVPRHGVETRRHADPDDPTDLSNTWREVTPEATVAEVAAGRESAPEDGPAPIPLRPRRVSEERCMLMTSKGTLTLHSKGGSGEVAVRFNREPSGTAAVTAATGDWSDIAVLAASEGGGPRGPVYKIVSVSGRAGTYHVTFNSPCGARRVAVRVE